MEKFEIIHFEMFGLDLREPMALVTNWLIAGFCFFAYFKLSNTDKEEVNWWRKFFLVFGISTFLGGLGHIFFEYSDKPGKFPSWVTGILANYCAGRAMIMRLEKDVVRNALKVVLAIKGLALMTLALTLMNFVFVAVDAIVTYLAFCGGIGLSLYRRGYREMRFMVLGVLICLPSAFVFLLNLNVHRWLNRDDLSHLFMLGCTICFYLGAGKISQKIVGR